jgi:hypothetical protein
MPCRLLWQGLLSSELLSAPVADYVVSVFNHTSFHESRKADQASTLHTVPMPSLCLVQFEVVLNRDGIFTKDASFHPENLKNLLDFTRKPTIHIY